MRRQQTVIVVGGGLAGMTAAIHLSEAGYDVQIFEAAAQLGGRTSSWDENGMTIESGLHRFLGFYRALPAVLQKVGIDLDHMLYWEDAIEIRLPDGISAVLGLAPLHKPLKTLETVLGNNDFLSPGDKASLVAMFVAAAKDYVSQPLELDTVSVAAYAKRHAVTKFALQRLLMPLTEGIFFVPVTQYSMYNLMGLLMPYLTSLPKLRVGAFRGGMSEIMMEPMAAYVAKHGGQIHTGKAVERLVVEDGHVQGVVVNDRPIAADYVVLAVSLYSAQVLLGHDFREHSGFQKLFRLPTMPAVTFQIELTAPSMDIDRTTFGPLTAMASFAEQSRTTFESSKGRLSIILSPPEKFIDMPSAQILEIILSEAKRLGVRMTADMIVDYRKVRLPHDFYSLKTGSEALRPSQATDIPGLVLAGDYTKQPYLATMEGAVVSGIEAANCIKTPGLGHGFTVRR